jgi:hypothetical protein
VCVSAVTFSATVPGVCAGAVQETTPVVEPAVGHVGELLWWWCLGAYLIPKCKGIKGCRESADTWGEPDARGGCGAEEAPGGC